MRLSSCCHLHGRPHMARFIACDALRLPPPPPRRWHRKGPYRQNALSVSDAKKWSRNYGFISDRAHRTRQKIAAIFTTKRVCLSLRYRCWVRRHTILGNFTHNWPRGNGSLNVSIVYIVTLQHVVKWLFYFVKYKKISFVSYESFDF